MKKRSRLIVVILTVILAAFAVVTVSYAQTDTASVLLDGLSGVCPSFSENEKSIVLPSVSDENYEVVLYGTSNESVIGLDGSVYTPLVDTEVEIMYKVVNKNDETDFAVSSEASCTVKVTGTYTASSGDNAEPNVLPKLREWKGLTGAVSITKDSKVLYTDNTVEATAALIAEYISGATGFDIYASFGDTASSGDIMLNLSDEQELGSEGYRISLEDSILISAPMAKGLLYGGTTIAQMLSLYENHALPRGYVRDYPQVEIRSVMLDVARVYVPLDYVEEIAKYMAYFKLNEIRLHINDNGGEQDHAFRLESKLYPKINSNLPADKVYTQEAYRKFQKNALDFGVTVITEIDTPAHSGFVKLYDESLMLDKSHIDLSEDKYDRSVAFVQSLISEFIDGDDPVILSKRVHIGMDEYGSNRSAFFRYMSDMTEFMIEKGIIPAVWGAIKKADVNDGMDLPHPDTVIHCWSGSEASYPDVIGQGYSVVNNSCLSLYVVPGGFSKSFPDRLNLRSLYESFDVNKIGGYVISIAHPQLLGVEAALWNDKDGGMSKYDIFSRMSEQIALVSEKGWFGARPVDIDGEAFEARFRALEYTSPTVNPSRRVETGDTDVVIDTDFSSEDGFTLNGAALSVHNGRSVLVLDGSGYISLPYKSVGYPWTLKLSLNYSSQTPASAILFDGEESKLYINYNGSGCIAYERQGRVYILDYALEADVWHDLVIVCDGNTCRLYKYNVKLAEGRYYNADNDSMRSSTLVLPTERIGAGIVGMLGELTILNRALDHDEITGLDMIGYGNVALNSSVTLSGKEWGVSCTPEMAVDGVESGSENRISLNRVDDAWFTIDLGKVCNIESIEIIWQKHPNKYSVLVSADGVEWMKVYENLECAGGSAGTDSIKLEDGVKARYVKYQQIEMFVGNAEKNYRYSGAFFEVKVIGYSIWDYHNVALNKDVTLSGTEWGVNCTPEMAVDGISEITSANRISLNKVDDAWFTIDLGKAYSIDLIEIFWHKRPNKYSMLVSVDGVEWTKVYENLECQGASSGTDSIPIIGGVKARYVKYQQIERFTSGSYQYSGAFTEIRIFGEASDNNTVLSKAQDIIANTDITDESSEFVAKFKRSYDLFEYILKNGTKEELALAIRALSIEIEKFETGDYTVPGVDVTYLINELKNKRSKDHYTEAAFENYELAYTLALSVAIDSSVDIKDVELATAKLACATDKLIPAGIAELNFTPKTSITLGSELVYNIYVPKIGALKSFTVDGETVEDAELVTIGDIEYYLVKVSLPAKEAARNIVLKATLTVDEKDYNGTWTVSIPKYAATLLEESTNEAEKTLVKDVLQYIRAAYTYFGTADAEQLAKIDTLLGEYASKPTVEGSAADETTGLKSATFVLDGTPSMRFYLANGADASKYKFFIDGKQVATEVAEDGSYVDIDVYAYALCETVTYTVDGETGGSFHINAYYTYVSGDKYTAADKAELVALTESFWRYLQSARAYRDSVVNN